MHLSSGTITYDIKLKTTHARNIPPLRKKLCERNDWDASVFNDIDWAAHGLAQKRLKQHKKTLVQYVNDWLPVGKRVHKYDPKYPECCPSCTAQVEDTPHLITCPSTSRGTWRKECMSNIKKVLDEHDTALPIKSLLLEGLYAALNNRPAETIAVEPAVAALAAQQAAIGWNQILKGRMSKLWASLQDRHLGSRATARTNGLMWSTKIIEAILMEWLKMWKLRNEDRHGRDMESRRLAETNQTIRELEQFYTAHDGKVTARLQWLFTEPIEIRREHNISVIIQWLNTWKPIVETSYNTALTTG